MVLLLTDGRATSAQRSENHTTRIAEAAKMLQRRCHRCLVIDTECGFIRLQQARHLAESLHAEYYHWMSWLSYVASFILAKSY